MLRTLLTALRGLVWGRPNVARPSQQPGVLTRDMTDAATVRSLISMVPCEGRPAMNAAYEKLIQHLDEREVRYLTNGESRSICADFRCDVGTYRIIAAVDADSELFQVFGYSPVRVPEGARSAVAETIARTNYGLKVGKFEMDVDSGELRFQAAQILTEDCLEETVIDRLLGTTMSMLDMYLPAVLSVIYGNELPQDAIRCAEAGRCQSGEAEGNERGADA
jgi:hypothetical protein